MDAKNLRENNISAYIGSMKKIFLNKKEKSFFDKLIDIILRR